MTTFINENSVQIQKNKVDRTTEAQVFHSSNHKKWPPYRILGDKTVKNVKIDSQREAEFLITKLQDA